MFLREYFAILVSFVAFYLTISVEDIGLVRAPTFLFPTSNCLLNLSDSTSKLFNRNPQIVSHSLLDNKLVLNLVWFVNTSFLIIIFIIMWFTYMYMHIYKSTYLQVIVSCFQPLCVSCNTRIIYFLILILGGTMGK